MDVKEEINKRGVLVLEETLLRLCPFPYPQLLSCCVFISCSAACWVWINNNNNNKKKRMGRQKLRQPHLITSFTSPRDFLAILSPQASLIKVLSLSLSLSICIYVDIYIYISFLFCCCMNESHGTCCRCGTQVMQVYWLNATSQMGSMLVFFLPCHVLSSVKRSSSSPTLFLYILIL